MTLVVALSAKTSEMLLTVDWLRRVLTFRVVPVLSLGILVVAPKESLRCMLRDNNKKKFDGNAQVSKLNSKKFSQVYQVLLYKKYTYNLVEIL